MHQAPSPTLDAPKQIVTLYRLGSFQPEQQRKQGATFPRSGAHNEESEYVKYVYIEENITQHSSGEDW